jgi:hypothetical protein
MQRFIQAFAKTEKTLVNLINDDLKRVGEIVERWR